MQPSTSAPPSDPITARILAGQVRAAVAELDAYTTRYAASPKTSPEARALAVLRGWAEIVTDPARAVATLEAAVATLDPLATADDEAAYARNTLVAALLGLGTARMLVSLPLAGAASLERALTLTSEPWPRAHALRFLAHAVELREHFEAAAERYHAAAAAYGRLGDVFGMANAEYGAGSALMRLGRIHEAEGSLRRATLLFRSHDSPGGLGSALRALSVAVAPRDPVEARLLIEEARRVVPRDALSAQLDITVGEAWLAYHVGDPRGALARLDDLPAEGARWVHRDARLIRAQALVALGDLAGARAALPAPEATALGDVFRVAIEAEIAAHAGDGPALDAALAAVERGLAKVRRDQLAVAPLLRAVAQLRRSAVDTLTPDDADRVALCLQLAVRAGLDVDTVVDLLRELRERGARVPLGPFLVGSLIAEGGMGQVWSAVHRESGRPVAVKVLPVRDGKHSRKLQALFEAEVRAMARIDHPNVVRTLAALTLDAAAAAMLGQPEGSPCLVMELVPDGVLSGSIVGAGGGFDFTTDDWPSVLRVALALLDALGHAHARGVVHLDVKPENVLLSREGGRISPRLTDFGLAGMLGRGGGRAFGTPTYMAPEQARGALDEIGPWTDMYALGGLIWCLCTGGPPFWGPDRASLMHAQCSQPLPRFVPRFAVPPGLRAWLQVALAKAPEDRFECAADAAAALLALGPVGPHSPTPLLAPSGNTWGDSWGTTVTMSAPAATPRTGRPAAVPMAVDWRTSVLRAPPPFLLGLGEGLLASRVPPPLGRDAIFDKLWADLRSLRDAGVGRLVLICGASGLGRSFVLDQFGERCHATGAARVLRATPGSAAALEPSSRAVAAPGRPTVILVDDLLRLASSAQPPIDWCALARTALVVATADRPPSSMVGLPWGDADVIALAPLSEFEIGQMLEHLLPLEGGLRQQITARSGGNPGFAVALLTELVRRQALVGGRDGFELRGDSGDQGDALALPGDVLSLWRARVDALAPSGSARRSMWELLAVLGGEVEADEWRAACALAGLGVPDDALRVLVATGWVTAGSVLRFVSLPLREALVAGCVRAATWHDVCARALTGDRQRGRRGRHLVAAGRPAEALVELRAGAADAVNATRLEDCRSLLELWNVAADAAGVPANDPRRAGVMVVWAHLALETGDDVSAELEEAMRTLKGRGDREESRGWYTLGVSLCERRRYDEAMAAHRRAIAVETGQMTEMHGLAWLGLAQARFAAGQDGSDEAARARAILGRVFPALVGRCDACVAVGLTRLGRYGEAAPYLARALPVVRDAGWRAPESELHDAASIAAFVRGDLDAAVAAAERAIAALRGTWSDREIRAQIALATLWALRGDRDAAARLSAVISRFSARLSDDARAAADLVARAVEAPAAWRGRLDAAALPPTGVDVRTAALQAALGVASASEAASGM
jgi:serine/threonine protein kinase/tetratricopeptide (TPR) repeat protein